MNVTWTGTMILALISVQADAAERTLPAPAAAASSAPHSVDLSGRWLLTLPAGFQYRTRIESLGDDRYRLSDAVAFNGVYEFNGDVLQIVEPVDERMTVFDWQLHNVNSMTLVDETGASGARYVGATLGRQVAWETDDFSRKVTSIGHPAVPKPPRPTPPTTPAGRNATVVGVAFNDDTHGPYLETEETIVFIGGLDAWPEEVIGTRVSVTGTLRSITLRDNGESLRAQRLDIESWRVEGRY